MSYPPERWRHGLIVVLEKIAGIALVNKLRAIIFMEANFNHHNKRIFRKRMLERAREECLISGEQYSKQQRTVKDGSFNKILQANISCQNRYLMRTVSADTANYYNRIHHTIMALVSLCIGVQTSAIAVVLR